MNVRYAFKRSLPVMAGYIVLGTGFGILLETKGYGVGWALAMSAFIYAGSMQYVAIDLLAGGASLISAAIMTLMVNARHLFYGISMLNTYKDYSGIKKFYLIYGMCDETFSVNCSITPPPEIDRKWFMIWVTLLNQIYWVFAATAGALLGYVIHFDTTGIEFVMTALFVVMFLNQWEESKDHLPALVGLICSAICLLIFGSSNFIVPSMIFIIVAFTAERRFSKKPEVAAK